MRRRKEQTCIDTFSKDVARQGGYLYSTSDKLSCRLANGRITSAIMELAGDPRPKNILDIGCGDGTYTEMLARDFSSPVVIGIDPSKTAVERAHKLYAGITNLRFQSGSAYCLPYKDQTFELAVLRGVLHHMDNPSLAVRESFRVAKTVIMLEPNGLNPLVKLLERVSPYHREHGEKSYSLSCLRRMVEDAGAGVIKVTFRGFVPMFSPDWYAKFSKQIEPAIEMLLPFACAYIVLRGEKP